MWFSELPFLTAIQAQAGFARSHGVNFLASGFNEPTVGSGGTGFYTKNGQAEYMFINNRTKTMMIHKIDKITSVQKSFKKSTLNVGETFSKNFHRSFYFKEDNLTLYSSVSVNESGNYKLCDRGLCCELQIKFEKLLNSAEEYNYKFLVFNGIRDHSQVATTGIQVCGLVQCSDLSVESCAKRNSSLSSNYDIQSLNIEGEFHLNNSSQIPVTLVEDFTSSNIFDIIKNQDYNFKININNTGKSVIMNAENLSLNQSMLVTFAIYGRYFADDGKPPTQF